MERLLTEAQVADLTGFAVQTLRNWRCRRKNLAYLKVNRTIRYQESDIREFLKNCKIRPREDKS